MAGRRHRVSPCRSAYYASPWWLLTLSLRRRTREAALLFPESWWRLRRGALTHLISWLSRIQNAILTIRKRTNYLFWCHYRPSKAVPSPYFCFGSNSTVLRVSWFLVFYVPRVHISRWCYIGRPHRKSTVNNTVPRTWYCLALGVPSWAQQQCAERCRPGWSLPAVDGEKQKNNLW